VKKKKHTLSTDTSVAQDADSFAHAITNTHTYPLVPHLLLLVVVQRRVVMAVHQVHHDDPLSDLRAVHAIGRA
jgi:hypothetical protein